jgi:hypothetical protein
MRHIGPPPELPLLLLLQALAQVSPQMQGLLQRSPDSATLGSQAAASEDHMAQGHMAQDHMAVEEAPAEQQVRPGASLLPQAVPDASAAPSAAASVCVRACPASEQVLPGAHHVLPPVYSRTI